MTPAPAPSASRLPSFWTSLAVLLLLAWWTRGHYSVDLNAFLRPWLAHIVDKGIVGAFATPFSNYNPPYLYLLALVSPLAGDLGSLTAIKLVSYGGHILLGLAMARLLARCGAPHPARAAVAVLLAPSLLINPAILVQCDAYWAAALVMALAAAVERRAAAMFLWCGLAVAFKAQAAFAAPFFLAVALAERMPYRHWLLAPAVFLATLLPAWLAGWPAADLLTIYLRQSQTYSDIALNAPNPWMVVQFLHDGSVPLAGWALALTVVAAALYVLVFARRLQGAEPVVLVRAACLCMLIVPGLLPQMHERYFFAADVLALALVMLRRDEWRVALFTQLGSIMAIMAYLSGASILAAYGALAMAVATWVTARPFLAEWRAPVFGRVASAA